MTFYAKKKTFLKSGSEEYFHAFEQVEILEGTPQMFTKSGGQAVHCIAVTFRYRYTGPQTFIGRRKFMTICQYYLGSIWST